MSYDYPLIIKNLFYAPFVYNPTQELVYQGTVRFTYADFRDRVRRLASALVQMGVKEGTTVGVLDWDSHRYLECFFAVPMIGAVLHTVNVRLSPEQLVYTIDHAEDELLLVHEDFLPLLEQIKGRIDTVKKIILIRELDNENAASTLLSFEGEYEELLAKSTPLQEFPDFDENTHATIFYTTGTTGLPKGVYFSHRQIVLHTLSGLVALGSPSEKGRFHTADVYMPLTPMFHVHAWGIPYMATVLGVKQVYPGKYVPSRILSLLRTEEVTFSHCVPTLLNMLLKDPASKELDLSRWKVIVGGSALPRELAREAMRRGIDIFSGYGLSETCPVLTIARITHRMEPDHTQADEVETLEAEIECRTRTGTPIPLVHLRVVDSEGKEVPKDDRTAGEICVRAPWLTQGYWKDHTNSERLWQDGWLHTGDIACMNSSGSIRITDRKKDVIKVGGEWVSSLALEDILSTHPAVTEVAVIAQKDPTWGELPLALIVLKLGQQATERDLVTYAKTYVDRGILPREAILLKVRFVPSLEKTSVGKFNKEALRQKYVS
ncbi:MAG: fatty acid--CoA ligase [Spirochaetes bacterium]|nr:fatty acid--CoA ligase [Spirochaetota bacterium]